MAVKGSDLTALYSKKVGKVIKYNPNKTTLVKYSKKPTKNIKKT